MKIFSTRSAQHLARMLSGEHSSVEVTTFADHEMSLRITDDVRGKSVWVIANTIAPSENLIEMLLLLDVLKRNGARINLFITYFGYARQDRPGPGESWAAHLIATIISTFECSKIVALHVHSPLLSEWLSFEHVIPFELFEPIARSAQILVSPDAGGCKVVNELAQRVSRDVLCITKQRGATDRIASMTLQGDVKGKDVLIVDDMISTGRTVVQASALLKEKGAQRIEVLATHGLFVANAFQDIATSPIDRVYVSNSVYLEGNQAKIAVLDIVPCINNILANPVQ